MADRSLSSYAESLNEGAETRNRDKIELIDGLAPFGGYPGEPSESIPPVDASTSDVVSCSVFTDYYFITTQQLEAYNQFVAG